MKNLAALGALAAMLFAGLLFLPHVSGTSEQAPSVSRGKYLVEAVAICF